MPTKHYVVKTKPCHEAIAKANLTAMGFEAYIPTVREDIRTRTQRLSVLVPMFPGYIFVRLDLAGLDWRTACSAKGVVEILPRSERPTAVPERAMEWVRESEATENTKRAMADNPGIAVIAGDEVTVTLKSGQTIDGVCQLSRNDRVKVLMTFMGQAREVEVPAESVTRRTA